MPISFRISGEEVEQPINKGLFKKKGFDFGKVPTFDKEVKNVENAGKKFNSTIDKIKGTKKSLTKVGTIEKGRLRDAAVKVSGKMAEGLNKVTNSQIGTKINTGDVKGAFNEAKNKLNPNSHQNQLNRLYKKANTNLKQLPGAVNTLTKIGKCYEPYVQKDMFSANQQYIRNPKSTDAVKAKNTKKK